ncbi:hypothetical protein F8M41_022304 [Gigaspora margarita]|uniref:Uncharacterized protein n=1 Tax=Gigaspora margarita TaxID=4874 RepID=A0A8H4AFA7_GIGMA|nr:hypothetical protein F8M41_022304 [Gigaspora margarita]
MSVLSNINKIFDIDKKVQEIDMDLDENNVDNILNFILDVTEGVGYMWEVVNDDASAPEKMLKAERMKTFSLLKHALEGFDVFSIQKLLQFKAIELKDQITSDTEGQF